MIAERLSGIAALFRKTDKLPQSYLSFMKMKFVILIFFIIISSVATGQDGNTARDWLKKGYDFYRVDRNYPEAMRCLDKAIELSPSCADGRCDNASCDKAICSEAWYYKGLCFADIKYPVPDDLDHGEAIKCYDRALSINSTYVEALSVRGWSLTELGMFDEALKSLDRALELDPCFDDAWDNKGYTLYRMGKNEDALECFYKAAECNPRWSDPQSNICAVLQDLGRKEEADEACARSSELEIREY